MAQTEGASEAKLALKPDYVDIYSPKVQLTFGLFATLLICIVSWAPSLGTGFLLDDFLHIDYVSRAIHGDAADFLSNFISNWAGSDLMKSYRPLVSLSLFVDFLAWGVNAWGYHLSNLLMHWGCCVGVGLISLELSGLRGNRLSASAAIWSMLLFAVYPLHLEAATWIIGRVDLLCTLFYLASIFCYFRFRAIREKGFFVASLFCFVLAMLCKEMAVTLPLVIMAAEFILQPLWREEQNAAARTRSMTRIMSYWFMLGIMATARLFILGELVGGYGGKSASITVKLKDFVESLRQSCRTFPQSGTLAEICFPANLDLLNRVGQKAWDLKVNLQSWLSGMYVIILLNGFARLLTQSVNLRIIAFLLFWMVVGILPTFQIWGVFPNLVGGRLFFLSSAPFVMALTFLALPAIDNMQAKLVKAASIVGTLALLVVLAIWSYWLHFDLQAWTGAAESLRDFKSQLLDCIANAGGERKIVVLNLPSDYSGAGMITRARYLRFMLKEPFMKQDLSTRVLTLDPSDRQGSNQEPYNFSNELALMLKSPSSAGVYVWDDATNKNSTGFLSKWDRGQTIRAATELNCQFAQADCRIIEVADASNISAANLNAAKSKSPAVEKNASGLRISLKGKGAIVLLPPVNLSSIAASNAVLNFALTGGKVPVISILWAGSDSETLHELASSVSDGHVDFAVGSDRRWIMAPVVKELAVYLPAGTYEIQLSSLTLR